MSNPSLLSFGADLAREQDAVLMGAHLTEIDLLRCARRAGTRASVNARSSFRLTVSVLAIAFILTAIVTWKLPAVGCQVQGEPKVVSEERLGQWVVAPASEPKVARFSDGSEARLANGSRMRLSKTSRWDTNVTLESGSVELEVTGKPFVDYQIGAGPFALALSKGRVQVSWDPMNELLDLVVEDGYVVISGCQFGAGRSVVAGKELGTRCMPRQPA